MKKRTLQAFCAATAATIFLAHSGTAIAEDVRMSVQSHAQRSLEKDLPRNGLSEPSVRNRWGTPQSVTGPVGEPPIYQWHYANFIVFFEDDRVIHTVLRQKP
jgi:hypothetical protein